MDGRAILDRDPFLALLTSAAPLFATAKIGPEFLPDLAGPIDEGAYDLRYQGKQSEFQSDVCLHEGKHRNKGCQALTTGQR